MKSISVQLLLLLLHHTLGQNKMQSKGTMLQSKFKHCSLLLLLLLLLLHNCVECLHKQRPLWNGVAALNCTIFYLLIQWMQLSTCQLYLFALRAHSVLLLVLFGFSFAICIGFFGCMHTAQEQFVFFLSYLFITQTQFVSLHNMQSNRLNHLENERDTRGSINSTCVRCKLVCPFGFIPSTRIL